MAHDFDTQKAETFSAFSDLQAEGDLPFEADLDLFFVSSDGTSDWMPLAEALADLAFTPNGQRPKAPTPQRSLRPCRIRSCPRQRSGWSKRWQPASRSTTDFARMGGGLRRAEPCSASRSSNSCSPVGSRQDRLFRLRCKLGTAVFFIHAKVVWALLRQQSMKCVHP